MDLEQLKSLKEFNKEQAKLLLEKLNITLPFESLFEKIGDSELYKKINNFAYQSQLLDNEVIHSSK